MADRGPPAPAPKAIRAKTAQQTRTREPPHKNPPKQKPAKAVPPLEPKVVVVVPVDQLEEQAPLYPPNQPFQLPDNQPDQPPNNPTNQPNPPAYPPNLQQIHQIRHLTLQQIHPTQCSHKTLCPKCHNKIGLILSPNFQASQRKMQ